MKEDLRVRDATEADLMRCPSCRRPARPGEGGGCPRCGKAEPLDTWEQWTAISPVEPEELNGGICGACGGMVTMWLARQPHRLLDSAWWIWLGLASILGMYGGIATSALLLGLVTAASALIFLLRCRGPGYLRDNLVLCHHCGFVRIGGREDRGEVRRWRGWQTAVGNAYRGLLMAFAFFAAVTGWALIDRGTVARSVLVCLGALTMALYLVSATRYLFGPRAPRQSATSSRP